MSWSSSAPREQRRRSALWLAVLLWAGCRSPQAPRVLTIAHEAGLSSLDPLRADAVAASVLGNFYEGLVDFDQDMRIEPRLALSWSTPGETVWEFRLRPNVKTHDGRTLGVEDVTCSLQEAIEASDSTIRERIWDIERAEAIPPDRVRIHTRYPDPLLLTRITQVPIHPCQARDLDSRPLGTGPYRFVRREGQTIEARAFADYWGGAPSVEALRFVVVEPGDATLQALARRDVQVLRFVPPGLAHQLESQLGVRALKRWGLRSVYLWLNTRPSNGARNPLADRRVRQALSLSLDRDALVGRLEGMARPMNQFVPTGVFGHSLLLRPGFQPDVDRARRLLREAGYPQGVELPLLHSPGVRTEVEVLGAQLAAAGIRLKPQQTDWLSVLEAWREAKAPMFIASWRFGNGDGAFFLEECLLSRRSGVTRSWNAGFSDGALDALIDENLRLPWDQRQEHFERINDRLSEEMPVVPLFERVDLYAVADDVDFQPRLDERMLASGMAWRRPR